MRQLTLGVRLHDRAVFDTFVAGDHPQALAAARRLAGGGGTLLYLHGTPGSGKSHLLQALCATVPGAAYLPLAELKSLGPEVLSGLAQQALLALDDLQAVAGDGEWERALFTLYNEGLASGARLAVAAQMPAGDLPLRLPDLRSRLAAMPHFALRPLDEAQQREALRVHAAARGMQLPPETVQYLQRRCARDMASLHALLEKLDSASLEAQRPLTVPFVRQVLGDLPD